MQKTKRLALLCLLLVTSVSFAVAVQATGFMESLRNAEKAEVNINTSSVSLILTAEDRQRVEELVLMDSQIQQILETAHDYTIEVSEIFDIHDISFDLDVTGNGVAIVPREGVAEATIEINNDYGDEFGVQMITVTVDLETDEITDIDVEPEVRRPKVIEDVISISELVQNPSQYNGTVVTVSGEVSMLGMVWSYTFRLDDTVTVFYRHQGAEVDVSNVQNGDTVTVTGTFVSPDTIHAIEIDEGNSETDAPEGGENVLSISELVENASDYEWEIVTVSGEVSQLGQVVGSWFSLGGTLKVYYLHIGADLDVSSIRNGDTVTVTGKFSLPSTMYAMKIEKP